MVTLRRHPYLPVFMDGFVTEDVLIQARHHPVAPNEAFRFDQVHFSNHPLPWYSRQIVHGIFGPRTTGGGRKFGFSIITNASFRFLVD